jgi:hypothetical protein
MKAETVAEQARLIEVVIDAFDRVINPAVHATDRSTLVTFLAIALAGDDQPAFDDLIAVHQVEAVRLYAAARYSANVARASWLYAQARHAIDLALAAGVIKLTRSNRFARVRQVQPEQPESELQ